MPALCRGCSMRRRSLHRFFFLPTSSLPGACLRMSPFLQMLFTPEQPCNIEVSPSFITDATSPRGTCTQYWLAQSTSALRGLCQYLLYVLKKILAASVLQEYLAHTKPPLPQDYHLPLGICYCKFLEGRYFV